tara:strand:+ start:286 stop:561 length:276 start_codon:yes stop_codon:yes gene_type:complete
MPFEKGNSYGNRKGRPKGADNKITKEIKEILQEVVFNAEEISRVYSELDTRDKAEFMVRMARYVTPEQKAVNIGLHEFKEQPLFLDIDEEE